MSRLFVLAALVANGKWSDKVQFDRAIGSANHNDRQVCAELDDLSGVGVQDEHGMNLPDSTAILGRAELKTPRRGTRACSRFWEEHRQTSEFKSNVNGMFSQNNACSP